MAENIIEKISVGEEEYSIDAAKLNGQEASYYQASGNITQTIDDKSTNSQYPSAKAVYDAINELPTPMVFKGSLGTDGTITELPTASSGNNGYVYKVITAGTYQSIACKEGDSVISNGTSWILIPSGDEPSGTVTSVAVKMNNTVKGTITTSGTIDLGTVITSHQDISGKEDSSNKVTSLSESSTDEEYPSAKAVYDAIVENEEIAAAAINTLNNGKVDKVEGKGLSTNDYDATEKAAVTANTTARHTHDNKALLDTYAQTEANLASAVTNAHSHSNKSVLDAISEAPAPQSMTYTKTEVDTALDSKVDKVTGKGLSTNDYDATEKAAVAANTAARHSHDNKALLDTYTQTEANLASAVTNTHTHSNKSELDLIVSGDKAKWDAKEDASNKVTLISSGSTDTQYPSAKCVYDLVGDIENLLAALR